MTDVRDMTDSELLAHYALPSLIEQESGGRAGVLGPQTRYGQAKGRTQVLDATGQEMARKLGVDWRPELMTGTSQEAAEYQDMIGRAYLQQGIEQTGNLEDGFRYYHGGPNRKLWGDKTNAYADQVSARLTSAPAAAQGPDLSNMSDDELLALYQGQAPKRPAPTPQKPPQRQDRTAVGNAVDAGLDAWGDLLSTVKGQIADRKAGKGGSLGDTLALLGSAANVPMAGVNSLINDVVASPIARATLDRIPLKPGAAPKLTVQGGRLGLTPARDLTPEEAHAANVGSVNLALSAAAPAKANVQAARTASLSQAPVKGRTLTEQVRAVTPQMPAKPVPARTPSVEDLKVQKAAAYRRAEAGGATIRQSDAQKLAADVRATIEAKGGKDLYPTASNMATRLENLAEKGITPSQLDDYRGQVYEQLMSDGGKEYGIGKDIRQLIDGVMDSDPRWAEARALNTRYEKTREVTDRLVSAELQADTNLSGAGNALTPQKKLRPLIDPKSPQRMRNLSPAEKRALKRVVSGTTRSRATRYAGQFLKNRFIQGASLASMGPLGLPGIAAPLALDVTGALLTKSGEAQTAKQIDALLRLLATGSAKAAPVAAGARPDPMAAIAALQAIRLLQPKPSLPQKKKAGQQAK